MIILKTAEFQETANTILSAVDSSELSQITETLQLKVQDNFLYINVTNKEYYAQVKININNNEEFNATVNANLFLKLVSQITTEDISFELKDTYLQVIGNGVYKLPLIFDGEKLLELPEIIINNPTCSMNIDSEILSSILKYNSKQLTIGSIKKPIQKFYYIDDKGAITFTSGGCVNSFALEQPIRLLLNNKLVKLFKLFKSGNVAFTLGYDNLTNDIIQTKVMFETGDIKITAILSCDDSMLNSFPVDAIRGRAEALYPYSVNINKDVLMQTINRLLLFSVGYGSKEIIKPYSTFKFSNDKVTIFDAKNENSEDIIYASATNLSEDYEAIFDLVEIKAILDTCVEQYLTINFGDPKAMVIKRGNISNIIPTCGSRNG